MRVAGVAVIFLMAAGGAAAQELSFDIGPTEQCLAEADWSGGPPWDCIGKAADQCMASPDGSTTVGMGFCLDAERQWWDERLNQNYRDLMQDDKARDAENAMPGMEMPSLAENLKAMQRAWIPFRDAACDYEMAQWGGGTGQGPAVAGCLMTETGRQALRLAARLGE